MDEFAKEVNNLLFYLRSFDVGHLVFHKYYINHNNPVPEQLLRESMERVQNLLDQLTKGERQ